MEPVVYNLTKELAVFVVGILIGVQITFIIEQIGWIIIGKDLDR